MQKRIIQQFIVDNQHKDFTRLLQQFMESASIKTKPDDEDIKVLDFVAFAWTSADFKTTVTNPDYSFKPNKEKIEHLEGPFWSAFLTAEARLALRGIELTVIRKLSEFKFVDFNELLSKINNSAGLHVADRDVADLSSVWELLILTGKKEGVDAALASAGLNENSRSKKGFGPLESAVLSESLSQLEYLITKIPALKTSQKLAPQPALHIATLCCQQDMVEYLLQCGIPVDQYNGRSETPLYLVYDVLIGRCKPPQLDMARNLAKCLHAHGADLTIKHLPTYASYLRLGIRKKEVMEDLIRHGVDVNADKTVHIRYAIDVRMYQNLKTMFDYGLQCTDDELRVAGLELLNDPGVMFSRNRFFSDKKNPFYWYCEAMLTNNPNHFLFAARQGVYDGYLRSVISMLKTHDILSDDVRGGISEIMMEAINVARAESALNDIYYDLLLQIALCLIESPHHVFFEKIIRQCLEYAFRHIKSGTMLTKEGHAAAAYFLHSDLDINALAEWTLSDRKNLAELEAGCLQTQSVVIPKASVEPEINLPQPVDNNVPAATAPASVPAPETAPAPETVPATAPAPEKPAEPKPASYCLVM